MTSARVSGRQVPTARVSPTRLVPRHSGLVRITHWLNVFFFSLLLMSGAQIFNAHPRLYWGKYGADHDHAWLSMESIQEGNVPQGVLRLGSLTIRTTGLLGASMEDGALNARGFPTWLTIPSYQDLAAGRRWHLFFAWLFVINGAVYLIGGIVAKHFARHLLPRPEELRPSHLLQEVADHARLNFPKGQAAKQYNSLQKLTYLAVVLGLLPLMVLTGLTMSPGLDAAFHFLPDIFGGRQSARSIHFICASLLVAFVVVHVAMVLLSGVWNNLRSMVTGRYSIGSDGEQQ